MKNLASIMLIVLWCSFASAKELTPKAAVFLKRCEQYSASLMTELKSDVQELQELRDKAARELDSRRKGTVNRRAGESTQGPKGRPIYATVQEKQIAVKDAEATLALAGKALADSRHKIDIQAAEIADGKSLFVPPLPRNYKVGDIGRFGWSVIVVQIIDGQNMIVRSGISQHSADIFSGAGIVGEGETDIRLSRDLVAWLRGKSTAGLADGSKLDFENEVLQVTGNTTYAIAAGTTKTVLVLEPFDLEPIKQAWKERRR